MPGQVGDLPHDTGKLCQSVTKLRLHGVKGKTLSGVAACKNLIKDRMERSGMRGGAQSLNDSISAVVESAAR